MPKPRRNHATRTRRPRAQWHAIPRPGTAAPAGISAAILAAAAQAEAAGARVLILALAPVPRLVLAAPVAAAARGPASPLTRAQADLRALDLEIEYAPDPSKAALLEMIRLDVAALRGTP